MLAGQAAHVQAVEEDAPVAEPDRTAEAIDSGQDQNSSLVLGECRSTRDLRRWLLKFARDLGFYGARYIQLGRPCWGLEDVDPGHAVRYLSTSAHADQEDEMWIAADPSRVRIRKSYAPFCWSTSADQDLTDGQRAWLDGERGRGVDAGLAIPVQDSAGCPAYISLFGSNEAAIERLIEDRAPELAFIAGQFHMLAKSLLPIAEWIYRGPALSTREIECLRLAALGRTEKESGQILGISRRTVEYHLRNAFDKLGATTKVRAVVLAFGAGAALEI